MFNGTGYNSKTFTLDVSNFDTSNVTNMSGMFRETGYSSETFTLDLSSFDTSSVTNMSRMFVKTGYNSKNLALDLSSFNTSKVTDMSNMFNETGRNSETFDLDLSNFNTSSVTNMNSMFRNTARKSETFTLDVSNFDLSNITDMTNMFAGTGCNSAKLNTSITIRNPNLTNYSWMFADAVLKDGSQIKVNYTSETEELADKMIATKSSNSNVVKGNLIVDVDNLAIGDEIHISGEKFNVISQTEDTVTMLAQYNLGEDYKQSESGKGMWFSSYRGWEYTPGPKEIDIQQYDGHVKRYLNAYVDYLKTLLKNDATAGDLISLKELEELGCTVPSDYAWGPDPDGDNCFDSPYGWLANGQWWWTRSADSPYSDYVWKVHADGYLDGGTYNFSYGVRPVVTISKES
jgi:surface protein